VKQIRYLSIKKKDEFFEITEDCKVGTYPNSKERCKIIWRHGIRIVSCFGLKRQLTQLQVGLEKERNIIIAKLTYIIIIQS
jgi:hypothetical protein